MGFLSISCMWAGESDSCKHKRSRATIYCSADQKAPPYLPTDWSPSVCILGWAPIPGHLATNSLLVLRLCLGRLVVYFEAGGWDAQVITHLLGCTQGIRVERCMVNTAHCVFSGNYEGGPWTPALLRSLPKEPVMRLLLVRGTQPQNLGHSPSHRVLWVLRESLIQSVLGIHLWHTAVIRHIGWEALPWRIPPGPGWVPYGSEKRCDSS